MGLALSLGIAIVIYQIVMYHFGFDNFHKDKDRVFRVTTTTYMVDDEFPNSGVPVPLSEVIKTDISGIEESVFFHTLWNNKVTVVQASGENEVFNGNINSIYADPDYFNFFNYQWLAGAKQSIANPQQLVISDIQARKYFGNISFDQILGRQIRVGDEKPFEVSGIFKAFESPTELIFPLIMSISTLVHQTIIHLTTFGPVDHSGRNSSQDRRISGNYKQRRSVSFR